MDCGLHSEQQGEKRKITDIAVFKEDISDSFSLKTAFNAIQSIVITVDPVPF